MFKYSKHFILNQELLCTKNFEIEKISQLVTKTEIVICSIGFMLKPTIHIQSTWSVLKKIYVFVTPFELCLYVSIQILRDRC